MKYFFLVPLYIYKWVLSPFLVSLFGHGCRFIPTCSQYAIESISHYGVLRGITLSLKRLAKCHPWGTV